MSISVSECQRVEKQSSFFDDVFRIELCDFEKSQLSVINILEIFRITKEDNITDENKSLIKNMIRRYIENPRIIILTIVVVNVDIAITKILDIIAKVDSSEQRTLEIIIKSDLIDSETKYDIMNLVRDRKKKLKLEYCVV